MRCVIMSVFKGGRDSSSSWLVVTEGQGRIHKVLDIPLQHIIVEKQFLYVLLSVLWRHGLMTGEEGVQEDAEFNQFMDWIIEENAQ